ncbi:hypothetical protein ACTXGU_19620 [Niallia sp. 01092]
MEKYKAKVIDGEKNEIAEIKWEDVGTANNVMPYHSGEIESL